MISIKELYDYLNAMHDTKMISYETKGVYPIGCSHDSPLEYDEALKVMSNKLNGKEFFMLAGFNEGFSRALYHAPSPNDMSDTLDFLSVPSYWPDSLGERVFYIFQSSIPEDHTGSFCIEQDITCDDYSGMRGVLDRLIMAYRYRNS
ncbi:MAG: hypothetical protein ACMXYL_04775 [Candidatus Woesearchaeota archaeon]